MKTRRTQRLGKDFIKRFVIESNGIEGYVGEGCGVGSAFYKDHYKAFMAVVQAVAEGQMPAARALHAVLLEKIDSSAGKYRWQGVSVEGWKPPHPEIIPVQMAYWEYTINTSRNMVDRPPWLGPLEAHFLFESIHPFSDGNGRVGRLLMAAHQLLRGEKPEIITRSGRDAYFEKIKAWREKNFANYLTEAFLWGKAREGLEKLRKWVETAGGPVFVPKTGFRDLLAARRYLESRAGRLRGYDLFPFTISGRRYLLVLEQPSITTLTMFVVERDTWAKKYSDEMRCNLGALRFITDEIDRVLNVPCRLPVEVMLPGLASDCGRYLWRRRLLRTAREAGAGAVMLEMAEAVNKAGKNKKAGYETLQGVMSGLSAIFSEFKLDKREKIICADIFRAPAYKMIYLPKLVPLNRREQLVLDDLQQAERVYEKRRAESKAPRGRLGKCRQKDAS